MRSPQAEFDITIKRLSCFSHGTKMKCFIGEMKALIVFILRKSSKSLYCQKLNTLEFLELN